MNKILTIVVLIVSLMGCVAALDGYNGVDTLPVAPHNGVDTLPGEKTPEHLFNQGIGQPWVGGNPPENITQSSSNIPTWDKIFSGSVCNYPSSILIGNDGYTIVGKAGSSLWAIKLDLNGNKVSDRILDGSDSEFNDIIMFPHKLIADGYLILGPVGDYQAANIRLKKIDFEGNVIWAKTFGGKGLDSPISYEDSIQQTKDGGYIFTGYTTSFGAGNEDIWLIKTDAYGNKLWDKTFGGSSDDLGLSVNQTRDGGYIILGIYGNVGYRQIWLIRTDSNGNKIWNKTFGKESHGSGFGYSFSPTSDGGYIILGELNSHWGDNSDLWLIKTDSNGNEIWNRTFGDEKRSECTGKTQKSVQQTKDGGYILVGSTDPCEKGVHQDIWLIKTDAYGNEIWDRTLVGEDPSDGTSVQQTSDGGYIISGIVNTRQDGSCGCGDIRIIKTDKNGFVQSQQSSTLKNSATSIAPGISLSEKRVPPPPPHKK